MQTFVSAHVHILSLTLSILPRAVENRFRRKYSGEYEGMSTSELAVDLRRDVEHYRGLWRTAKSADAEVTYFTNMLLRIILEYWQICVCCVVSQEGEDDATMTR